MTMPLIPVLFLAYHFPPIGGAGVQRAVKFVRYLPDSGYQPIVITGPGPGDDRWTPEDVSLLGEVPAGCHVHRTSSRPPESTRLATRLHRWLGARSAFSRWWISSATEACCRVAADERRPPRLVFATMSPFDSARAAANVARRLRIPWVADLRDPWALDPIQAYPTLLHRMAAKNRMCRALSSARAIIMNTPDAARALNDAFPALAAQRVTVITNGYDEQDFQHVDPAEKPPCFRIVHTGYLHAKAGLEQGTAKLARRLGGTTPGVSLLPRSHVFLLQALADWFERDPSIRSTVELVLAGQLTDTDHRLIAESPVAKNVEVRGYLNHRDTLALMTSADLLFLPMHGLPAGTRATIVPGKTYEYMASGRPILAAVPDGDARDFLERCGSAHICRPTDVGSMSRILQAQHRRWMDKAPLPRVDPSFLQSFERRRLTAQLAGVFDRVLAP